nr:hypothetical protein [Mesostigma viride]
MSPIIINSVRLISSLLTIVFIILPKVDTFAKIMKNKKILLNWQENISTLSIIKWISIILFLSSHCALFITL